MKEINLNDLISIETEGKVAAYVVISKSDTHVTVRSILNDTTGNIIIRWHKKLTYPDAP